MEFLHEPDGSVHFVHNSNLYLLKKSYRGELFMTCSMKSNCQASICLRQNIVCQIKKHNHIPDEDKVLAARFTKILRTRALEQNGKILDIYSDFLKVHPEAANHFKSVHIVKKGMGLARYYRPSTGYACLYNEPSGKIHCTFNSHIYRITKKYPSFGFAKCSMVAGCSGRAVIHQGSIRLTKGHNHKGSRLRLGRLRFLKELKYKSALTKDPLSRIFHNTSLKHRAGSRGMTFSSVKFQMKRARLIENVKQPLVWYMPLDHSKTFTRSEILSTTSSPINRVKLSSGHAAVNSPPAVENFKHQMLMKIDSDNLPTNLKHTLQPAVETKLQPSCAHLNKPTKVDPYGSNLNQQHKTLKVDPYVNQQQILPNQSQMLPPAQNLYFIMPPYYPPVAQQQKAGSNETVQSSPDSGIKTSTTRSDSLPDLKIDVKEEIINLNTSEIIDVSNDFDDEIKSEHSSYNMPNNMSFSADEVKNVMMETEEESASPERQNCQGMPSISLSDSFDANVSTQTEVLESEVSRAHTEVVTETLMEMHKILKNLRMERNSSNEVFGKYVATSMGCMTKRNAQAARREILDVLNKYES